MTFVPRRLADGRVCCSSPTGLCPDCEKYHGIRLRAAADYTPPNPYTSGLAALRVPKPAYPTPPRPTPASATPPDPYAAALAKLKETR